MPSPATTSQRRSGSPGRQLRKRETTSRAGASSNPPIAVAWQDVEDALTHLESRTEEAAVAAQNRLASRVEEERRKLEATLREQQKQLEKTIANEESRDWQLKLLVKD